MTCGGTVFAFSDVASTESERERERNTHTDTQSHHIAPTFVVIILYLLALEDTQLLYFNKLA